MSLDVFAGVGSAIGAGLNYLQQKRQFEYDKELQEKAWVREDNAVQRRVADLEAAGLSPTLAAGSAATSSSPIRAQVPGAGIGNNVAEAMQFQTALARQKQDIATSAAQEKLNKIQAENAELATLPLKEALNSHDKVDVNGVLMSPSAYLGRQYLLKLQNDLSISNNAEVASNWTAQKAIADAKLSDLMLAKNAWDFDITKQTGMRSYDQGLNGPLEAVIRSLGGEGTPYGSALVELLSKIARAAPKVPYIRGGP